MSDSTPMDKITEARNHIKATNSARNAAIQRLCKNHSQELRDITREIYAERGLEVQTRRTKQERLDEEIAQAKKLLIENGLL